MSDEAKALTNKARDLRTKVNDIINKMPDTPERSMFEGVSDFLQSIECAVDEFTLAVEPKERTETSYTTDEINAYCAGEG